MSPMGRRRRAVFRLLYRHSFYFSNKKKTDWISTSAMVNSRTEASGPQRREPRQHGWFLPGHAFFFFELCCVVRVVIRLNKKRWIIFFFVSVFFFTWNNLNDLFSRIAVRCSFSDEFKRIRPLAVSPFLFFLIWMKNLKKN